ncbi:TolC family protein [Megamonas hypermegale]|uniref:TolC family protein n=1 Tax=Megamonas hypermegale TaxID=158847 RepID=UPI001EF63D5F|nr:TolC family protein [Megamonas hypermegale]
MANSKINTLAIILSLCMGINVPVAGAASLSINDSVQMALERNNSIKIANQDTKIAASNLKAAKGVNGVSVSLSSNLSGSDGAMSSFEKGNSNGISASIPIYTGKKNELNIDNNEANLLKSQLNLERTKETVRHDTIKAYYDILEAQQNVNINQESVNNYQSHLTDVQNLYAGGAVPRSDLLRSEVALSNAQQSLILAQNTYDINVSTFRNIIKLDRAESVTLTDGFSYTPVKMSLNECLDYALSSRRDAMSAKLDLDIAKNDIDIAKAGYLPTVDFSLSTNWDKQPLPSSNDYDYRATVSANWNLFDSNITRANIEAAQAEYDKAGYTLSETLDNIDLEVRQAYLNMREAEKRFNSTALAVKQAEEDYFIATEKYRVGEGIILDVIDAELALSQARLNYSSAQYDYARYKASLEYAIGVPEGESIDG